MEGELNGGEGSIVLCVRKDCVWWGVEEGDVWGGGSAGEWGGCGEGGGDWFYWYGEWGGVLGGV